jgi:hypothetical protein
MHRTVRAAGALWIVVTLALFGAAGIAGAQEMDHGRTRPTTRLAQSNQIKTQDAVMAGLAGHVRG